jgi:hypothetical protein
MVIPALRNAAGLVLLAAIPAAYAGCDDPPARGVD